MEVPDKWLYEYCMVRYLPKAERGEFVNIGLLMMCKRQKWLKGRILLNPEKLRAIHPGLDIENLQRQAALFERTDVPGRELPVEEKYRWLSAEKSACLRVSPSHPAMLPPQAVADKTAEDALASEFDRLFNALVK
ncbi:MAG: DUF3037 domain-containing protein [Muribaculaceae bacterium]|nr:DUF3037 domain-containing protein [Muribaculaceae bacterium]